MKKLEAVIFVEPVAKGRARLTTFGGHARAYTPKKTQVAEADIKASIRKEVLDHGQFPAGVALRLDATFFRSRPKSLPKRVTLPVSKPDCDNYLKLLCDALNKFAFPDDNQLTTVITRKRFCLAGQVPRIELSIEEEGLE